MRHTVPAALITPGHTNLVGNVRSLLSEVHASGSTTLVLALLVGGCAVFVLAGLPWNRSAAGERPSEYFAVRGLQIAGLAAVFLGLAHVTATGGWPSTADQSALAWFTDHRTEWVTGPAIAITDAGGPVGTAMAAVLIGALLAYRARSPIPAVVLIGTVGVSALASTVAKSVAARSRPPVLSQVLLETDYSFPSGHATGATALFVAAALLLGPGLSPGRRRLLVAATVGVSAVVALTRLYLGEHWLTDVIAGMVLGGLVALAGSAMHVAWMRVRATDVPDPRHTPSAQYRVTPPPGRPGG